MTSSVAVGAAINRDEMISRVRELGPVVAERAVRYDREASFPWENFADLEGGPAGAVRPREVRRPRASYADYARSAEIGRHCGATALTLKMHNATMLWAGEVADMPDFPDEERVLRNRRRAELFRGVLDFTRACLRGEAPGQQPGLSRRDLPQKQAGWAQMQIDYEVGRALLYGVLDNTRIDPDEDLLARAWAAVCTVMENANKVTAQAIRVCGGQSMLKDFPLELTYRDSRLGVTMLPRRVRCAWTVWAKLSCMTEGGALRFPSDAEDPEDEEDLHA
jgi:alkylation response protein AidB-like acyl-CoA dehydrogenase